MDKLYSRKRIKLPDFKKINSIKAMLLIIFAWSIISVCLFLKSAYPVFKSSCETAASSKGNKIISEEVRKVMQEYTYNDLIHIDKDISGKITLIEANSIRINEITSKINSGIQKEFDKIPRITVFINMGSVSGISSLKNIEPKFEVELESAGKIDSNVVTEFKSVGINQTLHRVYVDFDCNVKIITPIKNFQKPITNQVIIAENVIVGNIPDAYYNLEGMSGIDDALNVVD